jgi:hypothetical protein
MPNQVQEWRDLLKRAQKDDALVAIYSDPDSPRRFAVGWVEALSEEHVVLRHISPSGMYDGYALRFLEDVFRVETGGRYMAKALHLYRAREQRHLTDFLPDSPSSDLLSELLLAAQKREVGVFVALEESELLGWVRGVGDETVTLERLDEYGESDGEVTIAFDQVLAVNADDSELQDLKLLSQRHSNRPPDWLDI